MRCLNPFLLRLHDFLFVFVFLERTFGFNEPFGNVGHVSLVADSFHSYLMWLHNSCQGDLGHWKWSAARDERRLIQMSTVLTCWSNINPGWQKHVTDENMIGSHILLKMNFILCVSFLFRVLTRVCVELIAQWHWQWTWLVLHHGASEYMEEGTSRKP